jgi:hypothetical protein
MKMRNNVIDMGDSIENSAATAAGAPEIKVTTAMIQAGVKAFCAFDHRFDLKEEGVATIYRAMHIARPTACTHKRCTER